MLPFDPLFAVAPLGAAAALCSAGVARRFAALAAACFALGSASLAAALTLAGDAGLAGVGLFSLWIDAGLEALGLALAIAGVIAGWRTSERGTDRPAALLMLLSALMIALVALPHLSAAFGAA